MDFFFHDENLLKELADWCAKYLTLTGFETRVCFVNHIDTPSPAHDLAVGMALLERFE
jgi:hypothetical protein